MKMMSLDQLPQNDFVRQVVMGEKTHRYESHFVCRYQNCDKKFNKSSSLIAHYMRHKNLRPFTCDLCGRAFTQSGTLRRHKKGVHNLTLL